MVHIHAWSPERSYARAATRAADYVRVNRLVREACPDMIIDNTSGGGMDLALEERLSSFNANPEVSDIDMGPFTVALTLKRRPPPLAGRDSDEVLSGAFPVTVEETETRAQRMRERGIKAVPALFNSGHWSLVYNLMDKGLLQPPYTFLFVMGMMSSSLPTPESLIEMMRHAPQPSSAFVMSVGQHDLPMSTMATLMGLHVMIGLATNLYIGRGKLADSNARFVERTVRIARELGRQIATPAQAREMLGLSAFPSSYGDVRASVTA